MSKIINREIDYNFDTDGNIDVLNEMREQINDMVIASIESRDYSSVESQIEELSLNLEKAQKFFDLEDVANQRLYSYAFISALTNLILELDYNSRDERIFNQISNRYEYLNKVVKLLNKENTLSGKQLKKRIKFSSDSSMTNFFRRVKPYDIFYIYKSGTSNYYSLTSRGRQYYMFITSNKNVSAVEQNLPENIMISCLESLSKKMLNDEVNIASIMYEVSVKSNYKFKNSDNFRIKLEKVISARNHYARNLYTQRFNELRQLNERQYLDYRSPKYDGDYDNILYMRRVQND